MTKMSSPNRTRRKAKAAGNNSGVELAAVEYRRTSSYSKKVTPESSSYMKKVTSSRVSLGVPLQAYVDRILNKGIVIDSKMSVYLIGLRVVDIESEVTVTSIETYLKYADAIGAAGLALAPAP